MAQLDKNSEESARPFDQDNEPVPELFVPEPEPELDQPVAVSSAEDGPEGDQQESAEEPGEAESEPGADQASVPDEPVAEAPSVGEVVLIRMIALGPELDQLEADDRKAKLRDIRLGTAELPEEVLGELTSILIANGGQFEPRVLHFTVKCLVARHPVVLAQPEPLPGNVLGGIARKLIEGEYTWDNLVVHPPRPRPEPEPEPDPPSSDDEQSTGDDQDQGSGDEPQPEPVPVPEPSADDPILATLRRQNTEMAALGF